MNKKTNILIGVIVILSLLLVCYGSFMNKIDMISDNNNAVDNDVSIDDLEQENLLSNDEAKIVVKELEEKYYDYVSGLGVYCGEEDKNDYITFGSYETNDFRDYYASMQFKNISELKEYSKSIMVEDLIPKYIENGVSYIEQNGKLYCQIPHKGGGFLRNYDVDAKYNIISIEEDKIICEVIFYGYYMSVELSSLEKVITIVKDNDNKWLVSNYDFKD